MVVDALNQPLAAPNVDFSEVDASIAGFESILNLSLFGFSNVLTLSVISYVL